MILHSTLTGSSVVDGGFTGYLQVYTWCLGFSLAFSEDFHIYALSLKQRTP